MHFYQRRRPSPLKIVPRQGATPTSEENAIESASSVGTTPGPDSPDSPDSPSPTGTKFEGQEPESPKESEASRVSTRRPEATTTSQTKADAPSATSTIAPAATSAPPQSSSVASNPTRQSTATAANTATSAAQTTQIKSSTAAAQSTEAATSKSQQPAVSTTAIPTLTTTTRSNPVSSSSVVVESTSQVTSTVTVPPSSAQSELSGAGTVGNDQPQKATQNNGAFGGMGKGAEAALITLIILGGLALIAGAFFFLRKKRRAKQEFGMRHAEDAFDPGNSGSLHAPETVHTATSHFTQSSTNSLFAPGHYERPETVSTEQNRSRIAPPQPTPNPFADPPLNKAYDVLRGRPRSTTLTDRGSWVKNPFKDPVSDRFDPFGELQEKARQERERYMRDLQREQQLLERERMGLGMGVGDSRKGSGATVEGLGVLDRSAGGQYPR